MTALETPDGFCWPAFPLGGQIFCDRGKASTTFDVTCHRPSGGVTYFVDGTSGNDANDGLSAATAFRRMSIAAAKPDVLTIMVAGGTYTRTQGLAGLTITRDIAVIGYNGTPLFGNHDPLVWTKTSGYGSVHHAARPAVAQVADMRFGMPGRRYVNQPTLELVDATPGSWFADASRVYVHTFDERVPDALIHAHLSTSNFRVVGDVTAYLENVAIHGGQAALDVRAPAGGVGPALYMKDVSLGYAGVTNGLTAFGTRVSIAQRCDAYFNHMDGFNYHALEGIIPKAIEVGCRGFSNGGATSSDNGSTIHDGGTIVRVGGTYYDNHGGNVVDVNDGTQSWNIGVRARDSQLANDFLTTSGAAVMWLDHCTGSGSWRSAQAAHGATLHATTCALERTEGVTHA